MPANNLLLLVPTYLTISTLITTVRGDTLSFSWVRYWLVVTTISTLECLLTKTSMLPNYQYRLLKYLVMVCCLLPAGWGGPQVESPLVDTVLTWLRAVYLVSNCQL